MRALLDGSFFQISTLVILVQLIFLECILSIDNAAVLGAMVAHLPTDKPTPWPQALRPFTGWADGFLGMQRSSALKVGLLGAYICQIVMLTLASIIIKLVWVQMLGALYLIYLGTQHFANGYLEEQRAAGDPSVPIASRGGFWGVVLALNLADMAFSIDNVIAAVALSSQLWVVITGVLIAITLIRFAATLFAQMIAWEPKLESGAYLLLLAIGIELIVERAFGIHIQDLVRFLISMMILLLTLTFARVTFLRPLLIVFRPGVVAIVIIRAAVTRFFGNLKRLVFTNL